MAKEETTTEEKVETKVNLAEQEWADDYKPEELTIPYKREEAKEEPEEEQAAEEEEPEEIPQAVESEAVVTVEDPGDYVPADYSFDVKIGDETIKVESVAQAEKLATEKAEELDAKALLKLMTGSNKMALSLERDEKEHADKKAAYEAQKQQVDEQNERVATAVREFDYLISKGQLPEIDEKYKDADWNDPEVAKQPGIKEQRELLTYMQKENVIRTKAGLPLMTSILEAFNGWQLEESKRENARVKEAAGQARKEAGARVVGTNSNPAGQARPTGIAVGRTNVFRSNQSQWE